MATGGVKMGGHERKKEDVDEEGEETECFSINYPVTVTTPDGTSSTVNNDEELDTAIDAYYEANPESEEDPTFTYPISVTLADGMTQEVGSNEELEALFEACEGGDESDDEEEDDSEENDDESDDDDNG